MRPGFAGRGFAARVGAVQARRTGPCGWQMIKLVFLQDNVDEPEAKCVCVLQTNDGNRGSPGPQLRPSTA